MKKWIFLTVFGVMISSNLIYSDDWQSHWFNGANALRNNDFNKAIEEYTLAINSVDSSKHPYLYIGRARACLKNASLLASRLFCPQLTFRFEGNIKSILPSNRKVN